MFVKWFVHINLSATLYMILLYRTCQINSLREAKRSILTISPVDSILSRFLESYCKKLWLKRRYDDLAGKLNGPNLQLRNEVPRLSVWTNSLIDTKCCRNSFGYICKWLITDHLTKQLLTSFSFTHAAWTAVYCLVPNVIALPLVTMSSVPKPQTLCFHP